MQRIFKWEHVQATVPHNSHPEISNGMEEKLLKQVVMKFKQVRGS